MRSGFDRTRSAAKVESWSKARTRFLSLDDNGGTFDPSELTKLLKKSDPDTKRRTAFRCVPPSARP